MAMNVYDIETMPTCFIYCSMDETGGNVHTFELSRYCNDYVELLDFLDHQAAEGTYQVGFNNINFDAQVIHYLLQNRNTFKYLTGNQVAEQLYNIAQHCIQTTNRGDFPPTPYWELAHKQIDLFRINHFDNMARRTSLKALEIAMRLHNVQDMPFHHTHDPSESEVKQIIAYCLNDVDATKEFLARCSEKIEFRRKLSNQYKTSFMNLSDSSIGEKLFEIMLREEMRIDRKQLKAMGTPRSHIEIGKILLPIIKFDKPEFKQIHKAFENLVVLGSNTKDAFAFQIKLGTLKIKYGTGGAHASIAPGIYTSDDNTVIHDIDVTSFYPNLAIVNRFRPKHLGKSFTDIYKKVFEERQKIPKSDPLNNAYKLMLNSVYGKSNNAFSYLYDPAFTMKITVNGQLLISMLAEKMSDIGQILQINTDGLTVKYDKSRSQDVEKVMKDWQALTGLSLESNYYVKFVVRDVNSYMAIKADGKIKTIGCFDSEPEWHQNPSFLVIPKALQAYYLNGTDPKNFIVNHEDFFDFMGRHKFNSNSTGFIQELVDDEIVTSEQQRNVRYYVSTNGSAIRKDLQMTLKDGTVEGRQVLLNSGKPITVTNKLVSTTKPDNIDYEFYIDETYKIINAVTKEVTKHGTQQSFF